MRLFSNVRPLPSRYSSSLTVHTQDSNKPTPHTQNRTPDASNGRRNKRRARVYSRCKISSTPSEDRSRTTEFRVTRANMSRCLTQLIKKPFVVVTIREEPDISERDCCEGYFMSLNSQFSSY